MQKFSREEIVTKVVQGATQLLQEKIARIKCLARLKVSLI